MKFLDLLRKIGILRFGAIKARYKNTKERPIELQENRVFNAKKELIHRKTKK